MRRTFPAAVVFLCICVVYVRPIEIGDFWWHLATGRWIVENGTLPETDPFSYTSDSAPDARQRLILKTYWLAQAGLYGAYRLAGFEGIIVLRALFYTLIHLFVYSGLRRYGLGKAPALALVLIIVPGMTSYLEARPQAVSFFFTVLVFSLLERLRGPGAPSRRTMFLLPATMLLWGNLHGGYPVGLGLIGVFALVETARGIRGGFTRRRALVLGVCAIALLSSLCNPSGPGGLLLVLKFGSLNTTSAASIHEYLTPLRFHAVTGDIRYLATLGIILVATSASFIAARRRIDVFHLLLAAVFAYAALNHFRFGAFFFLMGTLFLGRNLAVFLEQSRAGWKRPATLLPAAATILVLVLEAPHVASGFEEGVMPLRARDYLKSHETPAQLMVPYEWGGFFMWEFYGESKTFVDGRALSDRVFREYGHVMAAAPDTDRILSAYDVNTVLLYTIKPLEERIQPLTFALLKSDNWLPVHWDTKAIVFVRAELAADPIERRVVWRALTSLAKAGVMRKPEDAEAHALLAEVYYQQGLPSFARESFERALSLNPEHEAARRGLSLLRKSHLR